MKRTNSKKYRKQNKKNKKKIVLNCLIGTLALLGSAGTIAFGTLWCQSRNNGGNTPTDESITLNLDEFLQTSDTQCALFTSDYEIKKDQKIELVSKMSDIGEDVIKEYGFYEYYLMISSDTSPDPTFYWNCELYVDDNLISPAFYEFYNKYEDGFYNVFISFSDEWAPETFDDDTSVFRVVLTPLEDITKDIQFISIFSFNPQP